MCCSCEKASETHKHILLRRCQKTYPEQSRMENSYTSGSEKPSDKLIMSLELGPGGESFPVATALRIDAFKINLIGAGP